MKTLDKVENASAYSDGEPGAGLPESLLEAESALARLASVFFPVDETFELFLGGLLKGTKAKPTRATAFSSSRYRP